MEVAVNKKAIILTGGPGTGKTAIIDQLCKLGYRTVAESGRNIIRHQVSIKGNKLPWGDQAGYANEMFRIALRDFDRVLTTEGITFFDRGIPDVIGYLKLCKRPVPEEIVHAAHQYRYSQLVFITPPWQEIFRNDAQRKQTYKEAVATYQMMQQVYTGLEYTLVQIPKMPIEQRAAFIIDFLGG